MLNVSDTYHCLPEGRARILCQVAGCEADVELDGAYCIKRRVCLKHLKADVVCRRGYGSQPWRFCHQCGKLEPLTRFGARRSCREQLRRRRQAGKAVQKKITIKSSSGIPERDSHHKSVKPHCTAADSVRSEYDGHLLLWMQQQAQLQQQQILRQQEQIERLQALQQQQRHRYSALLAELQSATASNSPETQASAPAQQGSALSVVVEDLEPEKTPHPAVTAFTPWAAGLHTGHITALHSASVKPQPSAQGSGLPAAVLTGSAAPTAAPAAAEWAQTLIAAGTKDAPASTAQNAAAATGAGAAQMGQQQQQTQTVSQSAVKDVSVTVPPIAVSSTAMLRSSFACISQAPAAAPAATVVPMPESLKLSEPEPPQNKVSPAVVLHPAVSGRPSHRSLPGAAAVVADDGTAHLKLRNATVGTSNQTWRAVGSDAAVIAAAAAAPAAVAEVLPYWGDPGVAVFPLPIPVFPTYPGQSNHHPAAMAASAAAEAAEGRHTTQPIGTCSMGHTRDSFMHLLQNAPSGCMADVTMSAEDLTELLETALTQAVQQRQQHTDHKGLLPDLAVGLPPCPAAAAPFGAATLPADLNYGASDAAEPNLHLQQLLEPQLLHTGEQQTDALCSMVMSERSITHDSSILALNKMTSISTPDSFDDLTQVLSAALEDFNLPPKQGTGEAQPTGMQRHKEWSHSSTPQDRNSVLILVGVEPQATITCGAVLAAEYDSVNVL